jgi:transcriptional regulator of acetoin/glycerol metabolism
MRLKRAFVAGSPDGGVMSPHKVGLASHIRNRNFVEVCPKVQLAYTMYVDHRWSIEELCATLGISRATCYRYVALAHRAVAEG